MSSEFITPEMLARAERMRQQVNEKIAQMTPTVIGQTLQDPTYESDVRKVQEHAIVPDAFKTGEQDTRIWESWRADQMMGAKLNLAAIEGKSPGDRSEAIAMQQAIMGSENKAAPQVFDPIRIKAGESAHSSGPLPRPASRGEVRRDLVQVWNDKGQLIDEDGQPVISEEAKLRAELSELRQTKADRPRGAYQLDVEATVKLLHGYVSTLQVAHGELGAKLTEALGAIAEQQHQITALIARMPEK